MKKNKHCARLALVLAAALLLAACAPAVQGSAPADVGGRHMVPYSQMVYERPNVHAILTKMDAITEKIQNAQSFGELRELEAEAYGHLGKFYEMSTLAYLKHCQNMKDVFYDEENRYCSEAGELVNSRVAEMNRAVTEGPFAEEYRRWVGDEEFESRRRAMQQYAPGMVELRQERARLRADYGSMMATLTVPWGQMAYTITEIFAMKSKEMQERLGGAYYRAHAPAYAELYGRLVELDREIAAGLGFDSAADMHYALSFSRSYTPADAETFARHTKELFAPLAGEVLGTHYPAPPLNYRKALAAMPAQLGTVGKSLENAWNAMIEYELYDFAARRGKQQGRAFHIGLPGYDASFCFGYWDGTFDSLLTLTHEFGHYYANWRPDNGNTIYNHDVTEMHSQGLELVMQANFGAFVDDADAAASIHMQKCLRTLTRQIMLDEFQQKTYEMEAFDADALARLYTDLLVEYGLESMLVPGEDGLDHSWLQVSHLFNTPFYTVSYWTSLVVALQVWDECRDDWNAGRDRYLLLVSTNQNRPLEEIARHVGLRPYDDVGLLEDIAARLRAVFEGQPARAA